MNETRHAVQYLIPSHGDYDFELYLFVFMEVRRWWDIFSQIKVYSTPLNVAFVRVSLYTSRRESANSGTETPPATLTVVNFQSGPSIQTVIMQVTPRLAHAHLSVIVALSLERLHTNTTTASNSKHILLFQSAKLKSFKH